MSLPSKTLAKRRIPLLRILIGLVVITAVLNLGFIGAKALIKPGNGAAGTLLYATQFQNPNDSDWYQYREPIHRKSPMAHCC